MSRAVEGPLRFNLFERFAPSELSHSAFWAWVLQSVHPDCPDDLKANQSIARAMMAEIGATRMGNKWKVTTEDYLGTGKGRVDILVVDENDQTVVLETKVSAVPREAQLEGYRAQLESRLGPGRGKLAGAAILSAHWWRPEALPDINYVGLQSMQCVLSAARNPHPLVAEYAGWVDARRAYFDSLLERALSSDVSQRASAMQDEAGQ